MSPMTVLFRADASPEIGAGHMMRCIALGQLLHDHGCHVEFATRPLNVALQLRLEREGFTTQSIHADASLAEDAERTCEIASSMHASLVVIDGYVFLTGYQEHLKSRGFRLLSIDDLAACHYVSDAILNQNLHAESIFSYSHEPSTRLFLGSPYVLLRREFRHAADWKRPDAVDVERVLVTLGGSDIHNTTTWILDAMNEWTGSRLKVRVLVGSDNQCNVQVRAAAAANRHRVEIYSMVDNMVPLMQWADLAITAAGSTIWELGFLQTRMMPVATAENQAPVLSEMEKLEGVYSLGWHEHLTRQKFRDTFQRCIEAPIVTPSRIPDHLCEGIPTLVSWIMNG